MPHPLARRCVRLDPQHTLRPTTRDPFRPHDIPDPVAEWQAHVDAGRIGRRLPVDPEVEANRTRTEALFRSLRQRGGIW